MENESTTSLPPKSSCAYAYSLAVIKMLRKGGFLSDKEYFGIEKEIEKYYTSP